MGPCGLTGPCHTWQHALCAYVVCCEPEFRRALSERPLLDHFYGAYQGQGIGPTSEFGNHPLLYSVTNYKGSIPA
jgi:hypothetical protein